MSDERINKWVDFGERVAWTAIQAAAAAAIVVLTSGVEWQQGLYFVGVTTLAAVCKVVIAQNTGDETGAIPLRGSGA